jgi:Dolichyl-phosphate-mannose-protein mannosyltransferase
MSEPVEDQLAKSPSRRDFSLRNLLILAGLSVASILVMGYHPGLEDDSFYVAAIKKHLNPALFPHDADFFQVQFQATIFDNLVAFSAKLIRLPLPWTILLWQFAAVFLLLLGCYRLSRRCFTRPEASWAAVSIVGVLLSMPLPGIAILLGDQYLHPRTLASAAILAAIVAVIDRKSWLSGILLAIAFSIHAIAACFGISFCLFLAWNLRRDGRENPALAPIVMLLLPLGWLFEPASDA